MHAESTGSGEPVLLLRGGFCSLGTTCPQAEALAGSLRVHVVDHSDGAVIGCRWPSATRRGVS